MEAADAGERLALQRNRAKMSLYDAHRKSLAQFELLTGLASHDRLTARDGVLAEALIDDLLAAPDDFHHLLEMRLYAKLQSRKRHLLPKIIDLARAHQDLRRMRREYLDASSGNSCNGAERRKLLLAFAARLRLQIHAEERRLYPVLIDHLSDDEWSEAAVEMEAFEALRITLRNSAPDRATPTSTFVGASLRRVGPRRAEPPDAA